MINKKIICIFSLLLCTLACSCVNTTNTVKTKYINSKWEKHSEGKYEIISSAENMINYLNNLETENDKTEFTNYYNEKYFSNKQVIALKLEENSKDNINELTSYEIKNNELIIRIKTKTYGTTMEMSNMVVFLTLYNEEMQNFENVKIIKNNTLILAEEVNEQRISYLQKELQIDVHDSSNLEIIINSYEKFNEFIDSDNAECYISREELLTIYNEEYFNEKALIYVSKSTSTYVNDEKIIKLNKLDNTLLVYITFYKTTAQMISGVHFFIEVNQEDIKNTENVEIKLLDYISDNK